MSSPVRGSHFGDFPAQSSHSFSLITSASIMLALTRSSWWKKSRSMPRWAERRAHRSTNLGPHDWGVPLSTYRAMLFGEMCPVIRNKRWSASGRA
jgi:hypothetical protein